MTPKHARETQYMSTLVMLFLEEVNEKVREKEKKVNLRQTEMFFTLWTYYW